LVEIFQVDAFASRPFAGNPAAVCTLSGAVELAGRSVTVWRGRLTDDALAGS
jgi:hypothetical protein